MYVKLIIKIGMIYMENKDEQVKYYKEQISWFRSYRNLMYIVAAVVAISSAAIGLGLGMLLGNIAKGLVIAAAVGGIVETYPIGQINKSDIEIDNAETSLINMKKRISFERPDTYEKEKEEEKTLEITHDRSNEDKKQIDKEEKEFESKFSYKYNPNEERKVNNKGKSNSKGK